MKSITHYLVGISLLTAGVAAIYGCGGGGSGGGTSGSATATIMLSNQAAASSNLVARSGNGGGPVSLDEIESLTVSVTEVSLFRKSDDDDDDDDDVETVRVLDFEFDPTCITVEEGETVRWVWETDTLHTITSGSPGEVDQGSLFDQSASGMGAVVELIFADKGYYSYFSNTDADIAEGMAGNVKVIKDDDDDDDDDERHGGGGGGDDEDEGELITVFEGQFPVDLVDPSALSEVLTVAGIPAGEYRKIVLQIENPRLVLKEDPTTVIADVKLTANGRLFIKDKFEVGEEGEVIINVQIVGLHLVKAGHSGKYVLTPKVRAEVDVQDANIQFHGTIVEPPVSARGEDDAEIVWVQRDSDSELVQVFADDGTLIETDDDSNGVEPGTADPADPTVPLEFADLAVEQGVEVTGLLTFGGQVLADIIVVDDDDFETEVSPPAV